MVWVGEIQVGHRKFGERMDGVMELEQIQFDGRIYEVIVVNAAGRVRSVVRVGCRIIS